MFELASRIALRFPSTKGQLTVEDLWRLPLKSATAAAVTLDSLAQAEDKKIREAQTTVSFVDQNKPSKEVQDSVLRLEILKHIIGVKIKESSDSQKKKENNAAIQELASIIDQKKKDELQNLSVEELEARMRKLQN